MVMRMMVVMLWGDGVCDVAYDGESGGGKVK